MTRTAISPRLATSTFVIGKEASIKPTKSGYLYCFANDAWGYYENNRGFVTLTVSRD